MTTLERTIYEALLDAGASSEKALAVRDAVKEHIEIEGGGVVHHADLGQMTSDISDIKTSIAVLSSQFKFISGIVGAVGITIIVSIFLQLFAA